MTRSTWILMALWLSGCDAPFGDTSDSGTPDSGHLIPARLMACAAHPATPDTIAAVVNQLDALPAPVDDACFTASLARPLSVVAAVSDFSAQPSPDAGNPRIFLMEPKIVLSVVPDGDGAKLLELGQWETATRTLKGEIGLPVTSPLAPDAPLTRVAQPNQSTTCGLCHRDETPDATIDGGFVSDAFRPNPGQEMKLPALQTLHQQCIDGAQQTSRCDLFHALLDFGPVQQGAFADDVALFVQ